MVAEVMQETILTVIFIFTNRNFVFSMTKAES